MFESIVVPVDGSELGERATGVAEALAAAAHLPVELVRVVDPSEPPVRREELAERAARALVPCSASVLVDDDVVAALVAHLEARPAALVVLGTHARGPLTELLLGSVSEALLGKLDRPMLLVGPHVPTPLALGDVVVAAISDRAGGDVLVPWLATWAQAFRTDPWFVQVGRPVLPDDDGGPGSGLVHRLADELRHRGYDAQWDVLHARSTPDALVDFTRCMQGGVIAVASERWTSGRRLEWASTARSLVHRSPYPVLVVPLHRAPVPA